MELAGVTEDIRDPDFGRYERDKNGLLTGILYEEAQQIVLKEALRLTQNKKRNDIKRVFKIVIAIWNYFCKRFVCANR
ncbi:hypothetical protein RCO48_17380 [Peribacillus frigoritolerans]|nr:hypothetical protein [Peribacillus frigoritolerans]